MNEKLQKIRWDLHNYKLNRLLMWGLSNGYITLYGDILIKRLRNIYYEGVPASIILLSKSLCNGNCYDRAKLMSRAFLEEEGDVSLVYASVNSLKLDPQLINCNNPKYAEHCVVERVTKNGHHLIYDTSSTLVYDKRLYWLMEHPKVRKIEDKNAIIESIQAEEHDHPEDVERDKYNSSLIFPIIEMTYDKPTEIYARGNGLLQREVEHFKKIVEYDDMYQEDKDVKRLILTK